MRRGRRALGIVSALAAAALIVACTDGKTPDCGGANAAACAPSLDLGDARADRAEAAPDARDATLDTADADTDADAQDLDAGDEI